MNMNMIYSALTLLLLFGACKETGENITSDNAAQTPTIENQELVQDTLPQPEPEPMVYLLMKTTAGDITLELDPNLAPVTVANFLKYVDKGHYDSTIFHRVMPNFVIQGGGYAPGEIEKPTEAPIVLEDQNGLQNVSGSIAMARTNFPNSATSQFYINVKDNHMLDGGQGRPGYAVFGRVISGMETVNEIKNGATQNYKEHQNWPVDPVMILDVERLED